MTTDEIKEYAYDTQTNRARSGIVHPRRAIADTTATLVDARLFAHDPWLRLRFPSELHAQGRKLMIELRVAVTGLSRLDTVVPAVEEP